MTKKLLLSLRSMKRCRQHDECHIWLNEFESKISALRFKRKLTCTYDYGRCSLDHSRRHQLKWNWIRCAVETRKWPTMWGDSEREIKTKNLAWKHLKFKICLIDFDEIHVDHYLETNTERHEAKVVDKASMMVTTAADTVFNCKCAGVLQKREREREREKEKAEDYIFTSDICRNQFG